MDAAPLPAPGFKIGEHLRVQRSLGYFHHGVYIGEGRVVQFGGRIGDKPRASIGIVPLEQFEAGVTARSVKPLIVDRWSGIYIHEHDEPERIVERALWLVDHYPRGRYNVLGNNCEAIAIWCVTGGRPDSRQVRGVLYMVRLVIVYPLILAVVPYLRHRGRLTDRSARRAQLLIFILHLIPTAVWGCHSFQFARFIEGAWPPTEEPAGAQLPVHSAPGRL